MTTGMRCLAAVSVLVLLGACGGGGDGGISNNGGGTGSGGGTGDSGSGSGTGWVSGTFADAATFANQCQTPRTGTDPSTGSAWPDRAGTALAEKNFLRSWTNDTYLWFSEVTDRNPASIAGVVDYFDTLRTTAVLPNGRDKDEFHFVYNTAEYYALSQSGVSVGYGITWDMVSRSPPRKLLVKFVQPGSPAAAAGIQRGAEILYVDGVSLVNDNTQTGVSTLNAGLFPAEPGSSHSFVFQSRNGAERTVTMTANAFTLDPVPHVDVLSTATGKIGYVLFDDHIATAEQKLVDTIDHLRSLEVQDLVLDLRYNGGGYLAIASELAYMIAGPTRTSGRTFERLAFNSKHPATNPVTGNPLTAMPFFSQGVGLSVPQSQALPTLNLSRVYVLTTADTCSASESVINGLRGVGVEVIQFGGDTCGKPYGFYPQDNCGTTYFTVQFQGVNDAGFGDYAAGFSPVARIGQPAGAKLPGCEVADDYSHELGDPAERMLKVAMDYRANPGSCPLASSDGAGPLRLQPSDAGALREGGLPLQPPSEPWRNNRMLR